MTYCSRSCQRADWLNGHNRNCGTSYSSENLGSYQGRLMPTTIPPEDERAIAKLMELEINVNMIQLKLFLDHSVTILEQAKSLNVSLFDCVVTFNLQVCPPDVSMKKYSDFFTDVSEKRGYEDSRSKKNILCLYYLYDFTGDVDATTHLDKDIATLLAAQRHFPCEWLTHKK